MCECPRSPFYVKGVSLGHVGRNENLKDLKDEMVTGVADALWCKRLRQHGVIAPSALGNEDSW